MGSLNVDMVTGKSRELSDMMEKISKTCRVQETKWKGSKVRCSRGGVKVFYHGEDRRNKGAQVVV